jgi:hypothetical protein
MVPPRAATPFPRRRKTQHRFFSWALIFVAISVISVSDRCGNVGKLSTA